MLLTDRDVNAVHRAKIFIAICFSCFIQTRLRNNRVHANGGFSSGAVADDQFALTTANRNHRVDGHDAGLHRLADRFAFDDAGCDFFDGISNVALDRAFAVERLAERIHHATEQTFADGNLQQFAGSFDFLAFFDASVIAENNRADFSLFEVQCLADDTVAEVQHLVEHHIGQTFDLRHAVADFTDDADVLLGNHRLGAGNFRFNFLQYCTHKFF